MCAVNIKRGGKLNKKDLTFNNLTVTAVDRNKREIADYMLALKMADYIQNPNRVNLLDLMASIMTDAHLTGIIGKRLRAVRNKKIRAVKDGKHVEELDDLIKSKELRSLRKQIFYTELYGITGIEHQPGEFYNFKKIPRKHIKPHLKRITISQLGNEGYNYEEMPNILIMETDEDDNNYGLLLKAIPWVLYKRCNIGDLAQFIELFGQPPRVGKYDAGDIETRTIMEGIVKEAGAALGVVIPKTAEFEYKDVKAVSGDGKLHETMHKICDEQLSILILGQTETTKSSESSGYAQSKTHAEQQLEITKDDMDNELERLNDPRFLNILKWYGYPVDGAQFVHVEEADPTKLKARLELDIELNKIVPQDDDYWYETYNFPKPKNYNELKTKKEEDEPTPQPDPKKPPKGKKQGKKEDPEQEDDPEDLNDETGILANLSAWYKKYAKKVSDFFGEAPANPGRLMTDLADLYATRCEHCGGLHLPNLADAGDDMTAIINDITAQLYNKKLQEGAIPLALYDATAAQLMKGVFEGMGGNAFGYGDAKNELRTHLEHNIHAFSAAKSLTELKQFRSLMVDDNGKIRSEVDFRNACTDAGKLFNKTYLETERVTALATAQTAAQWGAFGEEDYIQISTVGDNRVRPNHQILDKFTAKKSDPVWRRLCPPFDWLCRCTLIPGVAANVKDVNKGQLIKDAQIPKYFERNPGITKTIFDKEHPYYLNSYGKEAEMSAEEVYGMPSVPQLYQVHDFPQAAIMKSKEAANDWWSQLAGSAKGSFEATDYNGLSIRFDNTFRKHVFEANQDSRWQHVSNLQNVIKEPDEVWSQKENGVVKRFYLKYYDDFPYVVRVDGADAYTFHNFENNGKLNEPSIKRLRRGVLIYRKN